MFNYYILTQQTSWKKDRLDYVFSLVKSRVSSLGLDDDMIAHYIASFCDEFTNQDDTRAARNVTDKIFQSYRNPQQVQDNWEYE